VELRGGHVSATPTATVFQNAPRLRHAILPSCSGSLLALALPWHQLTSLGLCPNFDPFLEAISLCTNLRECHITLLFGQFPTKIFPPAGIQLPHLQKLCLDIRDSTNFSHSDFFQPLVLPNLKEFAFGLYYTSDELVADLRRAIEGLSLPDLLLEFDDYGVGDVIRVAHSLSPLTTIKAPEHILRKSHMDIISHDRFQKLMSLEMIVRLEDTEAFIEMLMVQWSCARQPNRHLGIQSATIHVQDASEEDIFRLSQDIRQRTVGSCGLANYLS